MVLTHTAMVRVGAWVDSATGRGGMEPLTFWSEAAAQKVAELNATEEEVRAWQLGP